MNSTIV